MDKRSPPWFRPFLQRIMKTTGDPLEFLESLVKDNDIVRLPTFKANYLINDPDAIHYILLTNRDNYTKVGTTYDRIGRAIGKGLLTTSGEEWGTRHKEYQPLFHSKNLIEHTPTIQRHTEEMLKRWDYKAGNTLNITEEMLSLGMNISAEVFLGVDISDQSLELVRMIHLLNYCISHNLILWKWLPTPINFRYQLAKKQFDDFILSSLKKTNLDNKNPLLKNVLIKDEEGKLVLSDESILGEVKNFFVAVHETTGNALSWVLYSLAKNPYVLIHMVEEIKSVIGTNLPDFENIEELPYLDMVINETLRLYPPLWVFTRKSIDADIIQNYNIPPNSVINISPYLIQRHPRFWNHPNIFYPERFLKEVAKSRPRCAYIPFGFGPRACIGRAFALLNMKIILVMILQRFEVNLPRKNYTAIPSPLITLKAKQGIHLRVEKKSLNTER